MRTNSTLSVMLADKLGMSIGDARALLMCVSKCVGDVLDSGRAVRLHGLGVFKWMDTPARVYVRMSDRTKVTLPAAKRLKFTPSRNWRGRRRTKMSNETKPDDSEGMSKYGVVLDQEKTKEATVAGSNQRVCPRCKAALEADGTCPEHGTEPFEPGPKR